MFLLLQAIQTRLPRIAEATQWGQQPKPDPPAISDSSVWVICGALVLIAIVVGVSFGRLKERVGKALDDKKP